MSRDKGKGWSAHRHLPLRSRLSADWFVIIDEQLQSGLLPQSVMQSGAAHSHGQSAEQWTSWLTQLAVHKRGVAIPIPDNSRAAWSIVDQPRAVDCCGAGLQVVQEMHSRRSWDPIHHVLLFPYGTDGFHLDIPKDGKVKAMECYCWQLIQRDGWAGLNVVLYDNSLQWAQLNTMSTYYYSHSVSLFWLDFLARQKCIEVAFYSLRLNLHKSSRSGAKALERLVYVITRTLEHAVTQLQTILTSC